MSTTPTNTALCSPRLSTGGDPNKPVLVISNTPESIPENHILIKVDRFGFSANNITYQALGEHPHFRYFDFHPAPTASNTSPTTHGLIPVWGFATVVKSTHPKIPIGERIYGYLAPVQYLLLPVSPSDINKYAFYVPRPHLPADRRPYNQILRCATDPQYTATPEAEDLTMLYRPLFWTSYWCEDWINSTNYKGGVSTIVISSASAKTAFCLAYLIGKRISRGELSKNTRIIGLTSKRNVNFTKGLGLYREVYTYDEFDKISAFKGAKEDKVLYVDVAGNDSLNERIWSYFSSSKNNGKLVASISLGITNLTPDSGKADKGEWSKNTFDSPSGGQENHLERFFMPEWLDVRRHQLPVTEIFKRQLEAWKALMVDCIGWVKLERIYGPKAVKKAYDRLVKDGLGPDRGLIWSLSEGDEAKAKAISRL